MKQIEMLLPEVYARQLSRADWHGLEELRVGTGRPLRLRYADIEREIEPKADPDMINEILQRACNHSAYAYSDTIRRGYIPLPGGHRMGICGFGVTEMGSVQTVKEWSSLNIRVARQFPGCGMKLASRLNVSTLILGPPGSGKTTLLRDTVRFLSESRGVYVGLVDERGELSAAVGGKNQLDVGTRTDVLVNVPKAEAVMMLLRTMNPAWIALDEITAPEDIAVMEQASYCGVRLLATAHGDCVEDLKKRPLYRKLMETGVFRQIAVLKKDKTYTLREVET